HVLAGSQLRLDRLLRGALVVAVHERVLEEIAGGDHALEFVLADEVVVLRVALAGTRRARRVGNRQCDARRGGEHRVHQARLARTRGRRDDEQLAAHGCVTQGSAPVRAAVRSAPSVRPPPGWCASPPTSSPAYWLRD